MINLITRLDDLSALHPNKAAIIYADKTNRWQTVAYQELADKSQRFISGFRACSLTPDMRAVLMIPPSVEFFALAFALLKLGIVPIIVDPAIGLKKVGECLKESQPDIFFGNMFTHTLRILLGWGKDSIKHNLTISSVNRLAFNAQQEIRISQSPAVNSAAAIIYTSGSTGMPKGALYTHGNFAAQLNMLQQTFKISPDEIDLPAFPLYALIDVLLGITSIIPDISFPAPNKTNPNKVLDAIQRFKVANMFASPVVLKILTDYSVGKNIKLPGLKRVITAGAPATINLQEKFRKLLNDETDLFGIYGATEVLPIAKVESREIFEIKNKTAKGAGVFLGKPVDGIKIRIIPITDEPVEGWQDSLEVGPNVIGEIAVQGPAVTREYIAREEVNRLSKIQNGAEIIHRMGDVGYFDEQGRLWYCGRKSHRVITNEETFFTEQIENIFNAHPLANRTALVGVNGEPVLWVELERGTIDKDTIRRELIELAKDHPQASMIETFLFMNKFPTDVRHNSKIIRETLSALAEKRLS